MLAIATNHSVRNWIKMSYDMCTVLHLLYKMSDGWCKQVFARQVVTETKTVQGQPIIDLKQTSRDNGTSLTSVTEIPVDSGSIFGMLSVNELVRCGLKATKGAMHARATAMTRVSMRLSRLFALLTPSCIVNIDKVAWNTMNSKRMCPKHMSIGGELTHI